jgi:hypothetical protein
MFYAKVTATQSKRKLNTDLSLTRHTACPNERGHPYAQRCPMHLWLQSIDILWGRALCSGIGFRYGGAKCSCSVSQ